MQILKLTVAYLLIVSPVDKLVAYSVLLFVAALGVRLLYGLYCRRLLGNVNISQYTSRHSSKRCYGLQGGIFLVMRPVSLIVRE